MKLFETIIDNNYGSRVLCPLAKDNVYTIKIKADGDFNLMLFATDENTQRRLFIINRLFKFTTGEYSYTFRNIQNSILEYEMKFPGKAVVEVYVDKEVSK